MVPEPRDLGQNSKDPLLDIRMRHTVNVASVQSTLKVDSLLTSEDMSEQIDTDLTELASNTPWKLTSW